MRPKLILQRKLVMIFKNNPGTTKAQVYDEWETARTPASMSTACNYCNIYANDECMQTSDHNCKYNSKILLEITGHPVAPVCLLLVLTLKGLTFTTIIKLPPFLEQYSILCS